MMIGKPDGNSEHPAESRCSRLRLPLRCQYDGIDVENVGRCQCQTTLTRRYTNVDFIPSDYLHSLQTEEL